MVHGFSRPSLEGGIPGPRGVFGEVNTLWWRQSRGVRVAQMRDRNPGGECELAQKLNCWLWKGQDLGLGLDTLARSSVRVAPSWRVGPPVAGPCEEVLVCRKGRARTSGAVGGPEYTAWAGKRGRGVQGVDRHLMMAVRQSTRSCFFCCETGPQLSGGSFSEASGSSLTFFLFGRSLGRAVTLSDLGKLPCRGWGHEHW